MRQTIGTTLSNEPSLPIRTLSQGRTIKESRIIWLHCPDISRTVQPGQFILVESGPAGFLPRPFSIHQVQGDNLSLLFNVAEDGAGSLWLARRSQGDEITLFGPCGNGYHLAPEAKDTLLISGGIGIAPLLFLADTALQHGCKVTMLVGAGTSFQLYPQALLPPRARVFWATDDGSQGEKGTVVDILPRHLNSHSQIFACGPLPMYHAMAKLNFKWPQLSETQVSLETRMACGHGVCYGCTIKTRNGLKQVCHDGPVFNLDDIIWDSVST
jgi:dihydroorotate dehydrogenase electron transfer subunit